MKTSRFFCKILPALSAGAFLLAAGAAFTVKYIRPDAKLLPFFDAGSETNRFFFLFNFYVP
jgi:hypothetical protein